MTTSANPAWHIRKLVVGIYSDKFGRVISSDCFAMSAATNISVAETLPPSSAVGQAETVEFRRRMSSISRHSLVYFAGMLFSAAAGYFFKIYIARALGAEALGIYSLGMSIVGAIGIFNAVGLPSAGARFVAEYSSRREHVRLGAFLRAGVGLLGIGNVILGAILLLVAPWISVHIYHTRALTAYSWSFALIMLLGVLTTFLASVWRGFKQSRDGQLFPILWKAARRLCWR